MTIFDVVLMSHLTGFEDQEVREDGGRGEGGEGGERDFLPDNLRIFCIVFVYYSDIVQTYSTNRK